MTLMSLGDLEMIPFHVHPESLHYPPFVVTPIYCITSSWTMMEKGQSCVSDKENHKVQHSYNISWTVMGIVQGGLHGGMCSK